jgi:hypothetical protein
MKCTDLYVNGKTKNPWLFFHNGGIFIVDMCQLKPGISIIIACVALGLTACGEFDTVLSSGETYRVSARVEGFLLDTYGVVGETSLIRPYFANSVSGDPDIIGLAVFLKSSTGEIISKKVLYTLEGSPSQDTAELDPWIPADETADYTETGLDDPETARLDGSGDTKTITETETDIDLDDTDTPGDTETDTRKAAEQGDSSGVSLEIRSKKDPAAGARLISSGDTPARMVRTLIDNPLSEEAPDTLFYVSRLDNNLPAFLLPEDLEIGQYTLAFQLLGEREILHRDEKPFYYLGDAEFTLEDIQTYLPSVSEGSHIAAPGTMILLEVRVTADERLAPYVIWYNGKKRIGEGILNDGAHRLMWTAPAQTGFHALRAEVFPFRPRSGSRAGPAGKTRELSLPVSTKYEGKGYFSPKADSLIQWYQFSGNLEDTKVPGNTNHQLRPKNGVFVKWRPYGGIYGLALEAEDLYTLPGAPFVLPEASWGRGQFLLRLAPLGEGVILSGGFRLVNSPSEALTLELSYIQDQLVLTFSAGKETREDRLPLSPSRSEEFITAVINFQLEGEHFYGGLSLTDTAVFSPEKSITLSQPLSGEGSFRLGTEKPPAARQKSTAAAAPAAAPSTGSSEQTASSDTAAAAAVRQNTGPIAVIDELALTYAVELMVFTEDPGEDEDTEQPEDSGDTEDTEAAKDTENAGESGKAGTETEPQATTHTEPDAEPGKTALLPALPPAGPTAGLPVPAAETVKKTPAKPGEAETKTPDPAPSEETETAEAEPEEPAPAEPSDSSD